MNKLTKDIKKGLTAGEVGFNIHLEEFNKSGRHLYAVVGIMETRNGVEKINHGCRDVFKGDVLHLTATKEEDITISRGI